ncbi:hypothetical protein [Nonomuraea sp. NPDC050540]|uniref:hypothetical protein n=1 Tax=Nonomuraea sp. NPDC050540 TaxID=3364367 RepID=UPI0037ADB513
MDLTRRGILAAGGALAFAAAGPAPARAGALWQSALVRHDRRDLDPHHDYTLGLYNRGRYGTSHGWSAAHSVAWNCDVSTSRLIVQKPPTAQNYAIGCRGTITGDGPFAQPAGYIEGANRPGLLPPSLYQAQFFDRHR